MTNFDGNWKIQEGWVGKKPALSFPDWFFNLMANRGLKSEQEIYSFLKPKYEELLSPWSFSGMTEVVGRLQAAKQNNEKVLVYGDYDVDGITATALMSETLNKIGIQNETYIPHREEEGYGLNKEAITEIKKNGASLILTVDCGITSKDLIDESKIDFIVCDHHEINQEKLPKKAIILHPELVLKEGRAQKLAGCGMAFFLAKALVESFPEKISPGWEKWLLDLVALATICDVVPLTDQNRVLAKWGLLVLSKTRRPGLLALMKFAGVKPEEISTYAAGFLLGPRLNAAGRMEHAKKGLELLLTNDQSRAYQIARELNDLNKERQKLCADILAAAHKQIQEKKKPAEKVIVVAAKDWPRGVVGIIASRLTEAYQCPSIVFEDDGKELHGSARSVDGFDITAALNACSGVLTKFGGHPKAAGLSLPSKNLKAFETAIQSYAEKVLSGQEKTKILEIESIFEPGDINNEALDLLEKMEPFGFGNKTPVFAAREALVSDACYVGEKKNHLRFRLGAGKHNAIMFNTDQKVGEGNYDLAFTLKYNHWNNSKKIEVRVLEIGEGAGATVSSKKAEASRA